MSISGNRHAIARHDFKRLPAGGYICRIVGCEFGTNKDGQDMLILNVDICEGEFAGYFQKYSARYGKWNFNAVFKRKIFGVNGKDFADSFQQLLEDIEASNAGFKFNDGDINETDFIGRLCGFIFGDKEYQKTDGGIGTNAQVTFSKSVNQIREGNFKIPPTKKFTAQTTTTNEPHPLEDEITETDSLELDDPPF